MSTKTILTAISILLALTGAAISADDIDLHRLWDDRCFECHGHAAEFARRFLNVSQDELQGRHHVHSLRIFLSNHYLGESDVDAVYSMLFVQASSQARFRDKCSRCHDTAAKFVRETLEFEGGTLVGRESKQPVARLLESHKDIESEEIAFFAAVLTRVAHEVYRPQTFQSPTGE